jgi:ATP-dependent RNA helicase RhlE
MSAEIVTLSRKILGSNPEKVAVQPEQTTAEKVEQAVYFVSKKDKRELLVHLLKTEDVDSALVFSRTKHGANKIVKILLRARIEAEAIHGNKSQGARQRALSNFKDGRTQVLVATDIAARGIDVEDLSHVINYDLPNIPETYVHRIGRTGRARASGVAWSFCDGEERAYLRDIHKLIGQKIPVVEDHPYPDDGVVEKTKSEPRQQRPGQKRSYHGGQGGGNRGRSKRRRPHSRQSR